MGVIIGVIPAGAVGIGTNLLTADIKTEDQIRLNLSALRYLRTWIQALKFGVLIGALIGGAIFLIGFILSIPSAYTITVDSQQGDHVTAVWVLIVVYAIAFASIPGALGLLLGAVSVLVSSCRIVEFFVQLEHGYQRLRAGLVSNSLKFGILNVVLSSIPNLFVITSWFPNLRPASAIVLFVASEIGAFMWGAVGGFMISPLFRHWVLRIFLAQEGAMPLRYVTFLDYAAEIRILEKDGGHWRFRHQYLQEYFASLVA